MKEVGDPLSSSRFTTLLTLGFLVSSFSSPVPAQTCLEEGKRLVQEERLADALAAFDRCKQGDPDNAAAYFYSGVSLMAYGRLPEAALELKKAIQLDPGQADYVLAYADLLLNMDRSTDSIEVLGFFDDGRSLDQLGEDKLWLLSDLHYRLDQFDRALLILDRLAEKKVNDPGLDFLRGQIYLKKSDLDRALNSFQRAVAAMPDEGPPHFGVGVVLRLKNELEASRKVLLEAVRLEPTNPEYLYQLAEVCLALNRPEEAIKYLKPVEDSEAAFPDLFRLLGHAYRRMGDADLAQEYLQKFQLKYSEEQEQTARQEEAQKLVIEARFKLQEGALSEAQNRFEQALQKDPDNWLAHSHLAHIYLTSGFLAFAYRHLSRLAELDSKSAEVNYLLAEYWYQRRDFERARTRAEESKALYPGNGMLRNLLGNIYLELGQREKATQEYAAAVKLEPERSDFRINYQTVLKSLGKSPPDEETKP